MKNLKLSDYYFNLPEKLIAQNPADKRDESKLMLINRENGEIIHKNFYNVIDYLNPGDVIVLNESKVFPARLIGEKLSDSGVKSAVEFLLLENKSVNNEEIWEIIMKPGRKGKPGSLFKFGNGALNAEILKTLEDGNRIVKFNYDKNKYNNFFEVLEEIGRIPLPPYIIESNVEVNAHERYQTVYANEDKKGSAAAPTAGLHFTQEILDKLKEKGVIICPVTLHIGLGTFRPVKSENIAEHKMHGEWYSIPEESAKKINAAKRENRRVIAIGTTSCRTLEGCFAKYGKIKTCEDRTDIYIYGDYKFKIIDGLITNFHLPESTLLMLVSAFYTREQMLRIYELAVEQEYRFFSFGDAMFIY
jgi:S-adenosylmethionine:tRNA ribosyltransferase-isomerase